MNFLNVNTLRAGHSTFITSTKDVPTRPPPRGDGCPNVDATGSFACLAVSRLRLLPSLTSHHVAAYTGGSLVPMLYRPEVHKEASVYFLMGI